MTRLLFLTLMWAHAATANEVCRYAGTTDYSGHVAVVTDVATAGSTTTVDVTATFGATPLLWPAVRYQVQEFSTWRAGELQSLAVNTRYSAGDHLVRQQWDEFEHRPDGLRAQRVQAKTLSELAHRSPAFVRHWDPATFGADWLADYRLAAPERRPDLDLAGPPPTGLRTPLALAFYWVGRLPTEPADVPVFMPGFKARHLVQLPVVSTSWAGGLVRQTPLRYPALKDRPVSSATAWTSFDGHLLQLAFDFYTWSGSARGLIRKRGCEGEAVSSR